MVEVVIIVAVAENGVIGNEGDIPWHIPEDFQHFKRKTLGHPVIMGRKTWDSLPIKPLPGRDNIIITRNTEYVQPSAIIKHSLQDAIDFCKDKDKAFIIGGRSIYAMSLPIADTFELTRVHLNPEGDIKFPEVDFDQWNLISEEKHDGYTFLTYKKK